MLIEKDLFIIVGFADNERLEFLGQNIYKHLITMKNCRVFQFVCLFVSLNCYFEFPFQLLLQLSVEIDNL